MRRYWPDDVAMGYHGSIAETTEPAAREATLGTFTHPITLLCSSDGSTSEVAEGVVDTGATFTSIPAPNWRGLVRFLYVR